MIGLRTVKKFLDGKLAFDLWIETGSVRKAIGKLNELGYRNPRTGRGATPMGVWGAAWIFALDNLEYAKGRAEEGWRFHGSVLEDDMWNSMVLKEARYLYAPKRFDNFLDKNQDLTEFYAKSRPEITGS